MSNKVTDRELLAFCSLARLKLEFSQYKIVKQEKNEIIVEYKTPRKLIQEELEGQRNRRLKKSGNQLIEDLIKIEEKIKKDREEEMRKAATRPSGHYYVMDGLYFNKQKILGMI